MSIVEATAESVLAPVSGATLEPAGGLVRRTLRGHIAQAGLLITALVVLVALIGPLVAPDSPTQFVGAPLQPPSSTAPLGTDYVGRDVLSRVLWGGRSVLWMSLAATTLGVALGAMVGLLAGYSRSVLDEVLMRTMDLFLAFPQIVLVLLFVALLGPRPWLIVVLIALAWAPQVARVIRGATVELAGQEFVESAEALGVPRRQILARELLPNIATPLLVEYGLRLTWSISLIAALSFLGLGIQPPRADWGLMVNEGRTSMAIQAWTVLAPVICIAAFTVGTNLMTEGLSRTISGVDRETDDA